MPSAVAATQRFDTRRLSCPACCGGANLPQGQGSRCYGFQHHDPNWFTCTRLPSPYEAAIGWAHVGGPGACPCGEQHDVVPVQPRPFPGAPGTSSSRTELARRVWRETGPITGTPASSYLRSRAITIELPPTLGFAYLTHWPSDTHHPTLVAAITDVNGELRAVHRTYLSPDGTAKASVTPKRMMLGPVGGHSVHLADAAGRMAVTEGIETGLSVMQATAIPTWAALSAGGIRRLELPALPLGAEVVVAADGDRAGVASAATAANRWREEGRVVRIAAPTTGLDFNDLHLGKN